MAGEGNSVGSVQPPDQWASRNVAVASTTVALTCPHCEEEIEVRIESEAVVTPTMKLPFATVEEFSIWLRASALSVEEFQRLPVYESHRAQLEPLVRAVATSAEGEPARVGSS
jgi:hypothetical protein